MEYLNKRIILTYAACVVATIVGLFVIKQFNISYPIHIKTTPQSGELSIVGEGKAEIVPDTAYIDVGISVVNVPTANSAEEQINTVNNTLISAIKKLGIALEDIKTDNYSINPNYSYEPLEKNKITGYNGSATITVKIRDKQKASQVIRAATESGANQVGSVRFDIDNPQKYREQARDEAIANAKKQAGKLSKQLGIRLGRITNFVEVMPEEVTYPLQYAVRAEKDLSAENPVIEPGSQTVTSRVTLFFETK